MPMHKRLLLQKRLSQLLEYILGIQLCHRESPPKPTVMLKIHWGTRSGVEASSDDEGESESEEDGFMLKEVEEALHT